MTVSASQPKPYSAEEYLACEVDAEIRNGYCNGRIIPTTGGTPAHNEINSVLNTLLRVALKGQPYSVFITDQRLWIPERDLSRILMR
ncbi:MAG: Uma2 family endonuclease [Cyanobacteria bacterium J06633_2]